MDWKSLPSLSALRAFDAAARTQSFTGAARSLNVTPAAVMQQVRALEADLGLSLVMRRGRGIALTPDGETLATALDSAFTEISDSVAALRDRQRTRGLRVATTPNIVSEFLIGRLTEFWQAQSEIEVALIPSDGFADLAAEGYDHAVRGGDGAFGHLIAEHLFETRWVAVTAPSNAPADGPIDLSTLKWVLAPEVQIQGDLLRAAGLHPEALDAVKLLTPGHTLDAVREGLGATIANAFIVRKDVAAGRLRAIELTSAMPRIAYWAVLPKGPTRPATETFVRWLRTAFSDEAARYPDAGAAVE